MRVRIAMTIVMLGAASAASAQSRVPDTGMVGVGVSVGAAVPTAQYLDNGWNLAVNGEYYLTPRVSVRGQITGAWWDIVGQPENQARPMAFLGNVVYNWEHGAIHPYVTGGLGVYRYRFDEFGVDSSDTKFGLNLGGGVEYFFTRRDTITGELLVHPVTGNAQSHFTEFESAYWTLSAGYKRYFGGR